ncbi:enoyl-CoA hydratase/isomerase family protein [Ancylostoma ceylanicum]|uniref:Enoyl-CoA hydratase/isomerase family protein n=1 Tax=Ancylostoma ceylanicum TaxID=53326 RepID=A0A0D6LVH7_9BILA|nr:enoyl-CoA hydratase/isomerase family protein [Ancylostoma ceylanicum]
MFYGKFTDGKRGKGMSNHLVTEKKGNVFWIRFNRPEKYNAISSEMYRGLIAAFDEADSDEDVLITVLTGTGKYYSAGSDFSFAEMEHMRSSDGDALYKIWVDKIIRHTKCHIGGTDAVQYRLGQSPYLSTNELVVALVNGPALGVACTTLALCDVVLASDQAYFHCPFTELGLNPEGASSYTFVNIMGYQKAVRLALLAEKMSANELHDAGLVTKVIPHASFQAETEKFISNYSKLAHQASVSIKE